MLVLGGTVLKKGKFQSKYIVSLTQLKKNIPWRKLLLIFMEKEKNLTLVVCSLLPLKGGIKKCLIRAARFLGVETPGLSACRPLIYVYPLCPRLPSCLRCCITLNRCPCSLQLLLRLLEDDVVCSVTRSLSHVQLFVTP